MWPSDLFNNDPIYYVAILKPTIAIAQRPGSHPLPLDPNSRKQEETVLAAQHEFEESTS